MRHNSTHHTECYYQIMTVPAVGGTKGKRQVPCLVAKWAQGPADLATNPDLVIWEMWL